MWLKFCQELSLKLKKLSLRRKTLKFQRPGVGKIVQESHGELLFYYFKYVSHNFNSKLNSQNVKLKTNQSDAIFAQLP